MSVYMTEEQAKKKAQREAEVARAEYAKRMTAKQAASTQPTHPPLPYPYWNLGKEVAGSGAISGEPYKPAYVAPSGYVIEKTEIVTTVPRPPMSVEEALHPPPTQEMQVSLKPKTYEVPTQLFGIKEYEWNPKTRILTEVLYTRQGEKIRVPTRFATTQEILEGKATLSPHQQSALLGMGLTTVTATGVAVPTLGAFAIGGVTVAEVGKVVVLREHLTVPEAISAAGIGQMIGAGAMFSAKAFQPRVERSLEFSYRQAVEKGELWTPSLMQKIGMKITGAQPPRLAQEIVGAGEPKGVTFAMLKKGEVSGEEESYFWDMPTPRSAQVYLRSPEPRVKTWAVGTLVKRVYLEGLFTTTLRTGLISETEKTVKPEMPYIPKEPYMTQARVSSIPLAFIGVGVMAVTRVKTFQVTRQTARLGLMQVSKQVVSVSQVLGGAQIQRQTQRQMLGLSQTQVQKQMQKQVMGTPNVPSMVVPKVGVPSWFRAGGEAGSRSFDRMFGKWFPRTHKIKTWEQQLKTFGFGWKVPKSMSKFGKMEVPSLKAFKGLGSSRKRGRRKRR